MKYVLVSLSVLKTEVRYTSLSRVLFSHLILSAARFAGKIHHCRNCVCGKLSYFLASQLVHLIDATMAQLQQLQNDFLEYQKYLQDRFSRYRSGDVSAGDSLEEIKADFNIGLTARLNGIRARQIPRVRYAAQLRLYKQGISQGQAAQRRRPYGGNVPGAIARMSALNKRIAKGEFQVATEFMTARRTFHFIKILGAGGNG